MRRTLFLILVVLVFASCTKQFVGSHSHHLEEGSHILFDDNDPSVKIIHLEASNFKFEPSVITVKKGDKVRIMAKSIEGEHGVHLDSEDLAIGLHEGEEKIIDFIADQPGEYAFHCSVYCGSGHAAMKGKLIITE